MPLFQAWSTMMARQKNYEPVPIKECEEAVSSNPTQSKPMKRSPPYRVLFKLSVVACWLSLITNILLLYLLYQQEVRVCNTVDTSLYARVPRNIETPWVYKNPFWHEDDDTALAQMWDTLDLSPGTVALSDEYVESMGLPVSQRFPWDETKGIYQLDAYHQLHCLIRLHKAILEAKHGREQTLPWEHALHCIDSLRQTIMCEASDIPRYTGMNEPGKASGLGQKRMCRDWERVADWGRQHTACWKYINGTDENVDLLERFKFCPEGSPYNEKIYEHFGPPSEWKHSDLY